MKRVIESTPGVNKLPQTINWRQVSNSLTSRQVSQVPVNRVLIQQKIISNEKEQFVQDFKDFNTL